MTSISILYLLKSLSAVDDACDCKRDGCWFKSD